jgi:hypothetical protein
VTVAGSQQKRMAYSRTATDSHHESHAASEKSGVPRGAGGVVEAAVMWSELLRASRARELERITLRIRCGVGAEGATARAWRISSPSTSLLSIYFNFGPTSAERVFGPACQWKDPGTNTSTHAAADSDVTFFPLRHLISETNAPLSVYNELMCQSPCSIAAMIITPQSWAL